MRKRPTRLAMALWLAAVVALVGVSMAGSAAAQTPYVPYYGKNFVRYDRFDWQIYTTEHFEIYYYTALERHLERVAGYAESAYQHISSELKHDLAFKVPLILFKTHSEFEQQNVVTGAAQEGVGAFAESDHNRVLIPLDDPPDLLYRLIVHELTHVFQFDIVPQSLLRQSMPLWVAEGMSDYMTGVWRPIDLMTIRDAAIADIIPKMSEMEGYGNTSNPRLVYNLGHAALEFIESKWGKEGLRQFLFALRKGIVGGGEGAYKEAFQLSGEEFDQQFDRYLKARFKPFRDKETPADYGRNLAPKPEKTRYGQALTVEPSPSGDLLAAVTLNYRDQEVDIVLLSAKDGKVIRNLTPGFDQGMGFDYIVTPGSRWITVPWLAWSPSGDRLAYVVRKEKSKSIVVQNVVTRKIEQRIDLKTVDEPESPSFSPDGASLAFAANQDGISDIFTVDLATERVTNVTRDDLANYGPTYAPDGASIVYLSRVSGNEKLFSIDLATGRKTQLTFGTHDDAAARFLDEETIVFPSTAMDPDTAIEPEIARNGNAFNLWTLGLKTGELKQWTDALGGNFSPAVLRDGASSRIAFVAYYKGGYELHTLDRKEPVLVAAASDFGAPGPLIDFQAPLSHALVAENKRRKRSWDKLFMEGRPSIALGVTSGSDLFGGTALSFSDVLGDRRIDAMFAEMAQYRMYGVTMINLERRLNYAVQAYWQDLFYYGNVAGVYYDPYYAPYIDRDLATSVRSNRGASLYGIYPFDRYRRLEFSGGFGHIAERYTDEALEELARQYQQAAYGSALYRRGWYVPLTMAFVQETTIFREYGPLSGSTMRLAYEVAPKLGGGTLSWQAVDLDIRKYFKLGSSSLVAVRGRGFRSWGANPSFTYYGGNSDMRGYDYLEFAGQNSVYANAELRFPLIHAMATPIGVLGGIRGVAFFNVGGAWWSNTGFKFSTTESEVVRPITGYTLDAAGNLGYLYGDPVQVDGFRLVNGRASYGFGLTAFAFGFPVHFDWSWRTLFNKPWEDAVFALSDGGGAKWRRPRFQFWIGYDF
ncbi:MAG TPA: BamA/TamA family outer membrane protein [Vicinamibacterales bacterium]|nr:BamA/TamA family outer membrane protein [Vicinamibacterales bacterium]